MAQFLMKPFRVIFICGLLFAFGSLPVLFAAGSNCELARTLGGEEAYRECLKNITVVPPANAKELIKPLSNSENQLVALDSKAIYKRIAPSAFILIAAKTARDFEKGKNLSQGSAIAVTEKILLTAYHVVEDCRFIVVFQQENYFKARIVKAEPSSDRCILEVVDHVLSPVPSVRPFNSLEIGEKVYTIGAPRGLEQTIAEGIISGKRGYQGINLIQTTASISPGSSGGGLFDEFGRLIGITSFLISDSQALNFAISAEAFAP